MLAAFTRTRTSKACNKPELRLVMLRTCIVLVYRVKTILLRAALAIAAAIGLVLCQLNKTRDKNLLIRNYF